MRRFGLFIIAAALLASVVPAHATPQTVTINMAGFQYLFAGRITTDPTSAATVGSPDLAGTPMAAPNVHRGDTVKFQNYDPMLHTIMTDVQTTDKKHLVFDPLAVSALGGTNSFTVSAMAPLGKIAFWSKEYRGMLGYINVVS